MGSKAMGLSLLRQIHDIVPSHLVGAILHDDSADPRSSLPELSAFAEANGVEYRVANSRQEAKDQLREFAPDVAIACGWYSLFDSETITLPKYGILGLHNSLLPAYRGGSPLGWAIINGEPTVGATLFRMTDGMDDGPTLAKFPVDLGPTETIGDALAKLEKAILKRMPAIWSSLIDGSAEWVEQDHSRATFCALRSPEDGRIDWCWPAQRVHNFVRAQSLPYPCAFTSNNDAEVRIVKTELVPERWCGTPGQVISGGDKPLVSCGEDTAIRVLEVLVDGKPAPAGAVLKSIKMRLC